MRICASLVIGGARNCGDRGCAMPLAWPFVTHARVGNRFLGEAVVSSRSRVMTVEPTPRAETGLPCATAPPGAARAEPPAATGCSLVPRRVLLYPHVVTRRPSPHRLESRVVTTGGAVQGRAGLSFTLGLTSSSRAVASSTVASALSAVSSLANSPDGGDAGGHEPSTSGFTGLLDMIVVAKMAECGNGSE